MADFTLLYRRSENDWCKIKFDGEELFIVQQNPKGRRDSILLFKDEIAKLIKILKSRSTVKKSGVV